VNENVAAAIVRLDEAEAAVCVPTFDGAYHFTSSANSTAITVKQSN
jgi:hypothetical protein